MSTSRPYPDNAMGLAGRRARGNRPDRYRGARINGDRVPAIAARAVELGRDCLIHQEHERAEPIVWHHVRPRPRGGGDQQAVRMCANAHGRVHHLLDEIEAFALSSPFATVDEVLRRLPEWSAFDVLERAVAYRGWQSYGLGFLNGRYSASYLYWRTDGTAKEPDVPHFDDLYHASRWSRKWRKELDAL